MSLRKTAPGLAALILTAGLFGPAILASDDLDGLSTYGPSGIHFQATSIETNQTVDEVLLLALLPGPQAASNRRTERRVQPRVQ